MGCACLFALLAAGAPRLALILMWLFVPSWVNRAFDGSLILPLLGLIFLPLTTVIYVLVSPGGLSGFDWLLLFVGVVVDLGAYSGGAYGRRRQRAY